MKNMSRRKFMYQASTILAGTSLGSFAQLEIKNKLAASFFPNALADEQPFQRVIEIGLRSGVPLIRLGTGREFTQLGQARYANSPTRPNNYIDAGNGLYLNPNSQSLLKHAANIAITQGVQVEGGHTAMFASRQGGLGSRLTAPVVELSNRNTTLSTIHAVRWGGTNVRNRTNGLQDVLDVTESSLFDLFKRPYFPIDDNDLNAIIEASGNLSRQQAMILNRSIISFFNSLFNVASRHVNAMFISLSSFT